MQTGLGPKPRAMGVQVFIFLQLLSVWMRRCTASSVCDKIDRFCKICDDSEAQGPGPCGFTGIPSCQSRQTSAAEECLQCVECSGDKGLCNGTYCFYRKTATFHLGQCQGSTFELVDEQGATVRCQWELEDNSREDIIRCCDHNERDMGDQMDDRTTTKSPPTSGNEVNVTAIILGWFLSLVLLLVIVGAVILYFQRRSNPSGQPSLVSSEVEMAANGSNRAQLAQPPTLGGSVEYSYAYDHLSPNQRAELHTYDYVDEGEGNSRYFKNVPRNASSAEKGGETQGQYVKEEGDQVECQDERTIVAVDEVPDSLTEVRSTEAVDGFYFTLIPTEEQKIQNEASGYEVAAVPHKGDAASSSTEVLSQKGDNNTYFPLMTNNQDHKSPNEQSDRCKVAGMTQSATNEQGESETPCCSCISPQTTGAEQTSSYDHLVRDSNKASHDGAIPKQKQTTTTNI